MNESATTSEIGIGIEPEKQGVLPTASVQENLKKSAASMKGFIEKVQPEVIVLSGKSAEVSNVIIQNSGLDLNNIKILIIPPETRDKLYEAAMVGDDEDNPIMERYKTDLTDKNTLLVDDFLESGEKARMMIRGMKQTTDAKIAGFAAFSGAPDTEYSNDTFVGSSNGEFSQYIRNIASAVSKSNDPKNTFDLKLKQNAEVSLNALKQSL